MLLSFVRGCLKKSSGVEGARSILGLPNARGRERTKEPGENSAPTFHRPAAWLGQGGVVTVEKMGRDREREEGARGRPSFSPWLFWRLV